MKIPVDIKSESITAVIDTREQTPLDLSPLATTTATLTTGDYSVFGLEHLIAIERKSLPDLLACVGKERGRFEREVQRLLAFPVRALVVQSSWAEIEMGQWRTKVTPQSVTGSLLGWMAAGLPVLMAGDHARAGRHVSKLLFLAARRRWRENRNLIQSVCCEGSVRT
jgi:ERCC4-type nuclease